MSSHLVYATLREYRIANNRKQEKGEEAGEKYRGERVVNLNSAARVIIISRHPHESKWFSKIVSQPVGINKPKISSNTLARTQR